jgi:hypothetical protein
MSHASKFVLYSASPRPRKILSTTVIDSESKLCVQREVGQAHFAAKGKAVPAGSPEPMRAFVVCPLYVGDI